MRIVHINKISVVKEIYILMFLPAARHGTKVADMTIRASKHTTLILVFIGAISSAWKLFSPIIVLLVDM
jgi:hypothetical protein